MFDGDSKAKAFSKTFDVELPFDNTMTQRVYRWCKRDSVVRWLEKANKSLEVDWIDKRVNALNHLYRLGVEAENERNQIEALNVFLTKLDKESGSLNINVENKVNVVKLVSEKLDKIAGGVIDVDGEVMPKLEKFGEYDDSVAVPLKEKKWK